MPAASPNPRPATWKLTLSDDIAVDVIEVATKVDQVHHQLAEVPFAESPALVSVDRDGRTLELEWLDLGPSLGDVLAQTLGRNDIESGSSYLVLAAQALAAIHARGCEDPDAALAGSVFIHGDFGFSNIFVKTSTAGMLQILDPLPRSHRGDIRCGRPEVDVAMMLSCLIGRPPLTPWRHRRARRHLEALFVGEYQRLTGRQLRGMRRETRRVLMATCERHRLIGRVIRRIGFAVLVLEVRDEYRSR
jgi:hypothetical protein